MKGKNAVRNELKKIGFRELDANVLGIGFDVNVNGQNVTVFNKVKLRKNSMICYSRLNESLGWQEVSELQYTDFTIENGQLRSLVK